MTKRWEKTGVCHYTFYVDEKKRGSLQTPVKSDDFKTFATIGDAVFFFTHSNYFLKTSIEITNANGEEVIKALSKNWYSSSMEFIHNGKLYHLKNRNKLLAEWLVADDKGNDLLIYGLEHKSEKNAVRITSAKSEPDYLFDFLLWYLFYPIAVENCGDDLLVPLLMMSQ